MQRISVLILVIALSVLIACDREEAEPTSVQPTATTAPNEEATPEPTAAATDDPAEEAPPDEVEETESEEETEPTRENEPTEEIDEPEPPGPRKFKDLVAGADTVVLTQTKMVFFKPGEDLPDTSPETATVTDPDAIQAFVHAIGPEEKGERLPRMKCPLNHSIEFLDGGDRLAAFGFWCNDSGAVGTIWGSGKLRGVDYEVQHPKRMGRLVHQHLGTTH